MIRRGLLWLIVASLCPLVGDLSSGPKESQPAFGDSLFLGTFFQPTEINPVTTDSSIAASLLDLVYDSLVQVSGDGDIRPGLAERWEISEDGLTWKFYLHPGVRFHDGHLLTAEDIKATYDAVLRTKKVGSSYALKEIREIRVLAPDILEMSFFHRNNLLWETLGGIFVGPKEVMADEARYAAFNQNPIGTGPFRIGKQGLEEVVLEANLDYFGGRPFLNRIVVRILDNDSAALNRLIAGEIDMHFLFNPEDRGALSQIPTLAVYNNWYPFLYLLPLNTNKDLFKSPDVRRALNLAINRDRLIQRLLKGRGQPSSGTIPPDHAAFNQSVPSYGYHPDQALAILKDNGWEDHDDDFVLDKNGKKFEFNASVLAGDELGTRALQIMEEELQNIGITMIIKQLPAEEFVQRIFRERDFDGNMTCRIFRSLNDNTYGSWHSSQIQTGANYSSYENATVDHLLNEAFITPDLVERRRSLLELQEVFHDDPPAIFLFWRELPMAIHKRFRSVPETRMESLRDLIHVWVPKEEQLYR